MVLQGPKANEDAAWVNAIALAAVDDLSSKVTGGPAVKAKEIADGIEPEEGECELVAHDDEADKQGLEPAISERGKEEPEAESGASDG